MKRPIGCRNTFIIILMSIFLFSAAYGEESRKLDQKSAAGKLDVGVAPAQSKYLVQDIGKVQDGKRVMDAGIVMFQFADKDAQDFNKDPAAFLKNFLLKQGNKVRKITMQGASTRAYGGDVTICRKYHVQIPVEEYCEWIWV